jgi:uncharacterized membrane protein
MNSKDYLKSTKRLAHITRKFCHVFIWIVAIATLLVLAATIFVYSVPVNQIHLKDSGSLTINDSSLPLPLFEIKPYHDSNGKLNFTVDSGVLVPSEAITSVDVLRGYMWSFFSKLCASAAIFIIAAIYLIGLLKSVEKGEPFAAENAKRLRKISIVLIVGSVISPAVATQAAILATHSNLLDVKSNSMIDFTLLLCGFLILILSGIFAYGARLQREHDQTV